MIDVLYIVGTGSHWNNYELRYSLRTLEKYGKNIGRVFVSGSNPGFLSNEVIFTNIPDIDIFSVNHWYKVSETFKQTDISDNCLYMMDDLFFNKEVDLENYPYYYKNYLQATYPIDRRYNRCLKNTYKILKDNNKDVKNFGVHCPIIYNRQKFLDMKVDEYRKLDGFISPRSFYCNMYDIEGIQRDDLKIRSLSNGVLELEEKIKNTDCWSINDAVINQGVALYLVNNFKNKSKYER